MAHRVGQRRVRITKVGNKTRVMVDGEKVGDFKSSRVAKKIGKFRGT